MKRSANGFWILALALVTAVPVRAGNVSVSKLALVTIDGAVEVSAPSAKVWSALTDADKAKSWCPLWKKAPAAPKSLATLGANIAFEDEYGNAGKSVVIFVEPGRELRLAHAPDNGSYLCQARFVLEEKGGVTVVRVTEQYSDALDVPTDRDTAASTRQAIAAYLADLKTQAEKP
jgi:uncharacterized protein YndB with AHSA1/START domain